MKTYLTLGILLLGVLLSVTLYRVSATTQLRQLDELDRKNAAANIDRILNVFIGTFQDLETTTTDWAVWDDTHDFAGGVYPEYIDDNMDPGSMGRIGVHLFMVFDVDGKLLTGTEFAADGSGSHPATETLLEDFGRQSADLISYSEVPRAEGDIVVLDGRPVYLAASPVLRTDGSGPSRGTVVMGRFITADVISGISDVAGIKFNVLPVKQVKENEALRPILEELEVIRKALVLPSDRNTLDGFTLLYGLGGQPQLLLMSRMPRESIKSGTSGFADMVFGLLLAVLAFGTFIIWSLEKNLLGRLSALDQGIMEIGATGNISERLNTSGSDELSRLALNINEMLGTIQSTQAELKERGRELEETLHERDILLKEVHHRVKNNLQAVSSLFETQSAYIKDDRDIEVLREGQSFIQSVALIHQQLYSASEHGVVDFGKYLESLSAMLKQAYRDVSRRVSVQIDADEVLLNTDTAIPMGLVANEILSNAYKHAFPGEQPGNIQVRLVNESDSVFTLDVKDDGVGLPDDYYENRDSTLGHLLISSLVEQLDGALEMESEDGLRIAIRFTEYYECENMLL
jgi:two-component sensor histidine kinase/sensor domain CHASE-containing protein